ncbi:hypothetical protein [Microbacterium ulmi]|uniref:Uncharacterized protein n=1 Tax=Microbacterium ulmi TaxID=179095 RepID=A0A7Y2Q1J7_9MICO|nr:hypothetical protein [Microbacterium ulmi]NII69388.1 hypothetical protein [Microbacterium ulmi]NNH04000.1 hypothetical protein [Microbacterium ulmi]
MAEHGSARGIRRSVLAAMAIATLTVATVALSGCAPREEAMTPHESRDRLVEVIDATTALLGVDGWSRNHEPDPETCTTDEGTDGVSYAYGEFTAVVGDDPAADAAKVAADWEERGMQVRVVDDAIAVVYGIGGPVRSLSFSTGPNGYYLEGSAVCVPGDAGRIAEEDSEQ